MAIVRAQPSKSSFNSSANLPFELRWQDFSMAMQDVYDFFHDVNVLLTGKGLLRLDDTVKDPIGW